MSSEHERPEDRSATEPYGTPGHEEPGDAESPPTEVEATTPRPAWPPAGQTTSSWPPTDQSPPGWQPPSAPPPLWQPPDQGQPSQSQSGSGWQPPPGAWQPTQQPGPAWAPGAQQPAWQQPQPGWGPAYWAPQAPYGTSLLAVIAGIVLLVIGALWLLISAVVIALGAAGGDFFEQIDPTLQGRGSAIAAGLVVVFGVLLILGLLHVAAAIGVFAHKSWARWTGIVVAVIGLLFGLLALLGYTDDPAATAGGLLFVVVWLAAYGFSLVGLAAGGRHFARQQPWR